MDDNKPDPSRDIVAIIGAGNIGCAFALVFASCGFQVRVFDVDPGARDALLRRVGAWMSDLRDYELLDARADEVEDRIAVGDDLATVLDGVAYVQECIPEDLQQKRRLFADMSAMAPDRAVIASSSSAIPASAFAADIDGADRCLVAHPGNPPFLLRVVEVVPAPFTDPAAVERARQFLSAAGLAPVTLKKEINGFVFNRLQGAVLREAYCLVRDGVASVDDIDAIVRDGLGLRWAVVGPFETADLNRRGGIAAHAQIMGDAYAAMGAERGRHEPWTPELVTEVEAQCRARLPLERWDDRARWRDREIMKVLASRRT